MFQQVQITSKTTTGLSFQWNVPLESSNYYLNLILMPSWIPGTEVGLNSGVATVFAPLSVPQNGPNYGVVGMMENFSDSILQFQTPMVINQSFSGFIETFNAPTLSANYRSVYIQNPTGQLQIPNGAYSLTITPPVVYGSTGYAVVASMSNVTDPFPQIQPVLVTAKNNSSFTISWNSPTESSNYLINYYAISLTT